MDGFTSDNKNHFGIGVGIGNYNYQAHGISMITYYPLFSNYRYYFEPNRNSSLINISLGGLLGTNNASGVYSSATIGFKIRFFSFSIGLSYFAIHRKNYSYYNWYRPNGFKWDHNVGLAIKLDLL